MQLISNIKVKECSIISSFKSTSFDMFVTSSYSLGEGVLQVKYPLWKAQKKRYSLIFQELCLYTVLCLNRTRMSIIKKYLHTIKLLNHCISTTEWRPSFFWGRIGTSEEATWGCTAPNPFVCDNNNMFVATTPQYHHHL